MFDTFFDSEMVQASLEDITCLQSEVMMFAQYGMYATIDEQLYNLKVLRLLLDKQRNMFVRCMLSDSEEAKELADEIITHFCKFGYEPTENPMELFDLMSISIDEAEQDLKDGKFHTDS